MTRVSALAASHCRASVFGPLLGSLLFATVLPGQDEAAFDRAFAASLLPAATAADVAAAASAYLALPAGPAQRARLLEGGEALRRAGKVDLAQACVDDAVAAGMRSGPLASLAVRTAFAGQPFAAAVAVARRWSGPFPESVRAALVADEAKAGAAAEKAVRLGAAADGRFVFAQLAAARPLAAYRVANYALCLRQIGDVDEARRQYDLARALGPDDPEIENDFGLFLRAQGDLVGAVGAFWRAWGLDLARAPAARARGPAITNLVLLEAVRPGAAGGDPLREAAPALAARPDAAMLRRVVIDAAVRRALR